MNKILAIVLSICMLMGLVTTSALTVSADLGESITDTSDFELSSINMTHKMLRGYNIGDYLDATDNRTVPDTVDYTKGTLAYKETLWGNVPVTKEYIDYLKEVGIQSVRIPITWYMMLDSQGVISTEYLDRIEQIVNWIIDDGMYCVINIHHDDKYQKDTNGVYTGLHFDENHQACSITYVNNIWSQVATHFKDYGSKLLFEAFNEVMDYKKTTMTPSDENELVTAEVLKAFISTVRSSGGNNAQRFLVCPRYGGVSYWPAAKVSLFSESDTATDKLILTSHAYSSSAAGISSAVAAAKNCENNTGIGCILDEIGDGSYPADRNNGAVPEAVRLASNSNQIACFWWDNGQNEFALVNRYYCEPSSKVALSQYVGKTLDYEEFTDISQMIDSKHPYYAKFYSSDSNEVWGGKYIIVCSEKRIQHIEKYRSRISQGYYSMHGLEEGSYTYYVSSDDKTYTRMVTRIATTYQKEMYNDLSIYGSTVNMVQTGGNYTIAWNNGGRFYTKDYTTTFNNSVIRSAYLWNTSKWGYINFIGMQANINSYLDTTSYYEMNIGRVLAGSYSANVATIKNYAPYKVSIVYENGTIKDIGNVDNKSDIVTLGSFEIEKAQNISIRFATTTDDATNKNALVYYVEFMANSVYPESSIIGDANDDGCIDSSDVLYLRKYLAQYKSEVQGINNKNADCNADSRVNLVDLLTLRKYIANIITSLG